MARCLIIGCGCHGLALAGELRARGHTVRATTRRPERIGELEAAGVEGMLGDPDRVATLVPAFEHATLAFVLLGSAAGSSEALAALHGSRLDMLLTKLLDTTVRGIAYQAAGRVDPAVLAAGAARVTAVAEDSRIPYAVLRREPGAPGWLAEALGAAATMLEHRFGRTGRPASVPSLPR